MCKALSQIPGSYEVMTDSTQLHRSRSLLLTFISALNPFTNQYSHYHFALKKVMSVLNNWMLKVTVADSPQVIAFQGIYDIWIHKGAVSIYGAILRASPHLQRVVAPPTHSIPKLKISCDPYGGRSQTVVMTIFSCDIGVCFLNCFLPGRDRIRNVPKLTHNPDFWADVNRYQTFHAVRHPGCHSKLL